MPTFPSEIKPEVEKVLLDLNDDLLLSVATVRMAPRGGWTFLDAIAELTDTPATGVAWRSSADGLTTKEPISIQIPAPSAFDVCDPYGGFQINPRPSATTIDAGKFLRALGANSPQADAVSRLWVVWFYALWDEHYRHKLAEAHGCEPNAFQHDYFGDLRKLRHDTAHGKGIARKGYSASCSVLRSFPVGDRVVLRHTHFREIIEMIPWEYLAIKPEPAPQRKPSLTAEIDSALRDRFRAAAAKSGVSVHTATAEAIELWLEAHSEE
ncbi:hypothetical protein ACIO52_02465 [Nocardia sp. NPDC087230]|uniref:hypothetical protein n=1 Tax=Nocardia sp. NPDC087230 TaxID=3364331 RepID=UPI003805365E